jgi:serine/threonine protein kinase/formylglycine-generating enzyme required for sulfatase activity
MIAGEQHRLALPAGYQLGKYRLREVLGSGGFGITYLAEDSSLKRRVAIKELLPNDIATRLDGTTVVAKTKSEEDNLSWARERFVDEGRALAACEHPNVVHVYEMVEANGTAYMVTKFEEGRSMARWLSDLGRAPTESELRGILLPLLSGLEKVHQAGFLHRDIKPENIYLTTDGRPVLLDFGSARQAVSDRSMAMTSIVTSGYAPFEQYHEDGKQGAWSDIYAFAAVMYRGITGKKPPEATRRMKDDPCVKLAKEYAGKYSAPFLSAIDKGLSVEATKRPQSVAAWREMIGQAPAEQHRKRDRDDEQLAPWWKKHIEILGFRINNPPVAIGAAAVALAVVAFAGWKVLQPPTPPQPDPRKDDKLAVVTPKPEPSPAPPAPGPITPRAVTPGPIVRNVTPVPVITPATPEPIVVKPAGENGPKAGEKWQNSLGMNFVPLPGRRAHIGATAARVRDFEAFVKETGYDATMGVLSFTPSGWKPMGATWQNPGFHQTPDHPVAGVCAYDAAAFCQWLTAKEQRAGLIDKTLAYRLPTDAEWSDAMGSPGTYAWGESWPPPAGFGNFASEEAKVTMGVANANMISNYRDGFAATSPVGTFPANAAGIFDLGGNVLEWCDTAYAKELNSPEIRRKDTSLNKDNNGKGLLVLRGSTCFKSTREIMRVERRVGERPVIRSLANGFRVVLAPKTEATLLPGDFSPTNTEGQPNVDPRLAGLWETRFTGPMGSGTVRWEQRPDGTFITSGSLSETGRLTSKDGKMRQYSDSAWVWVDVSYEIVDGLLVTMGPLGRAEWRPVAATAPLPPNTAKKNPESNPPPSRERNTERDDPPPNRPPSNVEKKARDIIRRIPGIRF